MQATAKQLAQADVSRLRAWIAVVVVLAALLLQAYLPLLLPFFSSYTSLADLPLLVTIYLALLRRSPISGLVIGMAVGLAQDSLSDGPIGMYGILKTIIGYACSALTLVIAVDPLATRAVLVCGFYVLHQGAFWLMERALLGQTTEFLWGRTLLLALINGLLALVVYRFLDRFREST